VVSQFIISVLDVEKFIPIKKINHSHFYWFLFISLDASLKERENEYFEKKKGINGRNIE